MKSLVVSARTTNTRHQLGLPCGARHTSKQVGVVSLIKIDQITTSSTKMPRNDEPNDIDDSHLMFVDKQLFTGRAACPLLPLSNA